MITFLERRVDRFAHRRALLPYRRYACRFCDVEFVQEVKGLSPSSFCPEEQNGARQRPRRGCPMRS
jgi:hypothetical protein